MAEQTKWILDPTHSEIQFKVKHLMISSVTGQFKSFDGTLETTGTDFSTAKTHVNVDVNSIDTNNQQRDEHLRANDFFDTENFPELVFKSTKIEKEDDENYKLHGTLTMRGISKDIVLNSELGGVVKDFMGNEKAGFSLTGKVNRKDFGITWSMLTETGGIALGDEVKLLINAQFIKQ